MADDGDFDLEECILFFVEVVVDVDDVVDLVDGDLESEFKEVFDELDFEDFDELDFEDEDFDGVVGEEVLDLLVIVVDVFFNFLFFFCLINIVLD